MQHLIRTAPLPILRIQARSRLALHPLQHHTHMQQVAVGRLVDRGGVEIVLDRSTLAKIDRRVFAELDHGDGPQMVKVPLSDAAWSAWRRYCEVLGLTMGEGIAGLIGVELTALVDDGVDDNSALSVIRAAERLAGREARVAVRERDLETAETRQRERDKRLRRWEGELEAREALLDQASRMVQRRDIHSKIGRNDRCPCGSGLKYKQCHGLLARGANPIPR